MSIASMGGARVVAAAGALLLPAAYADAADGPAGWTDSGNVTVVSDYIFRGVSQSQHRPVLQAGLDLTHGGGAYLGTFASGVSTAAYPNGAGAEIDLYGGYRWPLGPGRNVDLGLVTYWYPGAHYAGAGRDIRFHTQDVKLGWNEGSVNVYGWYTISSHWFGFAVDPVTGAYRSTRGTTYVEANWNPGLDAGLVLNLHLGHQHVHDFGALDYSDVKAGVSTNWGNWAGSFSVTHNNGAPMRNGYPYWTFYAADGSGRNVVGTRALVTLARNF